MPKPTTPFCGCDVFVNDASGRVLLIRRIDNGLWALPGGCQELSETPAECAVRECREETGLDVRITHLLGVWSSRRYEYVTYPWKDNVFTHLMFKAELIGGEARPSSESSEMRWFDRTELPSLSDGHDIRILFGFSWLDSRQMLAYFE